MGGDLRKHQDTSGFLDEFHPYTKMLEEISVPKGLLFLYSIHMTKYQFKCFLLVNGERTLTVRNTFLTLSDASAKQKSKTLKTKSKSKTYT